MLAKLDHIRQTKLELSQARAALEEHHQLLLRWRERENRIAQMAQKYLLFSVPQENWSIWRSLPLQGHKRGQVVI